MESVEKGRRICSLAYFLIVQSHIVLSCLLSFISIALATAQQTPAHNGKFETVNGANIYYEEYGEGEPLLLLHGFGGGIFNWKSFIPELSKHYKVIAWDMRGHGLSANPDTSVVFLHATAAKDLLALLDKLNLTRVKAIGHSSGGIVILMAAIMEPNRFEAIVPMSAQMYYSPDARKFVEDHFTPEAGYEMLGLGRQHGEAKGHLLARQFYHFHELYGDPAITPDQLATISARTLLVHGDNDFVPVEQSWEMFHHISGAHLWIVPNGSHRPQVGAANEAEFTRRVL